LNAPRIYWLSDGDPAEAFPPISSACTEPDGLLAAGGDLSPERLLYAYRHGIFPWNGEDQVVLWWSPNPRCILRPAEFHVSRRLRRDIKNSDLQFSFNQAFAEVVAACAASRPSQDGTWITSDMAQAYGQLHELGWAHSVEIWRADELVGGLYGLAIGHAFFGESMFSRVNNASKIAMLALCHSLVEHRFSILDCQVVSPHLLSLGVQLIPREEFRDILNLACDPADKALHWPTERLAVSSLAVC